MVPPASPPAPPSAPVRCYRCQRWGHGKSLCKEAARCGICSQAHWTESCLARLRGGEKVSPCCINCKGRHHVWNPNCPAKPALKTATCQDSTTTSTSKKDDLKDILLHFAAGLCEALGFQPRTETLQKVVKSSLSSPLLPRPVLLQKKVQEAPCGVPSELQQTAPPPVVVGKKAAAPSAPRRKLQCEALPAINICTTSTTSTTEAETNTTPPPTVEAATSPRKKSYRDAALQIRVICGEHRGTQTDELPTPPTLPAPPPPPADISTTSSYYTTTDQDEDDEDGRPWLQQRGQRRRRQRDQPTIFPTYRRMMSGQAAYVHGLSMPP